MKVFNNLSKPFKEGSSIRIFENKWIVAADLVYALDKNFQTFSRHYMIHNVVDIDGRKHWEGRIQRVVSLDTARKMCSDVLHDPEIIDRFIEEEKVPIRKRKEPSVDGDIFAELVEIRKSIKATAIANIRDSPEFQEEIRRIKFEIIKFIEEI